MLRTERMSIPVGGADPVSTILTAPPDPIAIYSFAHGAGAGMEHRFMEEASRVFAEAGIATLRFNFPYKEHGRNRPDRKRLLHATVRAAAKGAAGLLPGIPLFAGGKSMGGRMSSEAQADSALPGVKGLIFLGFPLHPAGREGTERADHLAKVEIPMLFLQGTRDRLAELSLLKGVIEANRERAELHLLEGADHGFHVLKRSGRTDEQVLLEIARASRDWITRST